MSSRYTEEEYTDTYKRKIMETVGERSPKLKLIREGWMSNQEYRILKIYCNVCRQYPSLTKFSKFNKVASRLNVSADRVRFAVIDSEKHGGCHLEQSVYPARQQDGWYKEFYGKSISKEDYYAILEDVDSTLLRVPTLGIKYAITSAASRLRVSEAIVAAVLQDRQKTIGQ